MSREIDMKFDVTHQPTASTPPRGENFCLLTIQRWVCTTEKL